MSGDEKKSSCHMVTKKRQVSAAWLVQWLVRKPMVRKVGAQEMAGCTGRLHPKGQYPNTESIAVATESPVAKRQVAMVAS